MANHNLKPMIEIMEDLRNEGFELDFVMKNKKFVSSSTEKDYVPGDITIVDEYRFEGDSNPDDMSILYAIRTKDGEKGLAVNGYGVSADPDMDAFLMDAQDNSNK